MVRTAKSAPYLGNVGLVQRFGGRVPQLKNGDRIIAEGAAWVAHDGLRLSLAKPVELLQPDGTLASALVV